MEQQHFWITGLIKKNGTIEYDTESLSYYRKDAIKRCVKSFGSNHTWEQLYRWRRRTFKVTIQH